MCCQTLTTSSRTRKQAELKKAQLEDRLEGKLERRPERDELERLGILKDQQVAPALQGKLAELERSQLEVSRNVWARCVLTREGRVRGRREGGSVGMRGEEVPPVPHRWALRWFICRVLAVQD